MKRILSLALAGALLLCGGCSALLERSYSSSADHVDYYAVEEDPSVLRAETYQGLVNSILYFVESHAVTGTIRLYNYTGDAEADLASACAEILNEDPLGAYAVRDIRYDATRIVAYYEVSLSIIYSKSAQAVDAIQPVTGLTSLRTALSQLITGLESSAAYRVSYFSWTQAFLEELFWQALCSQPLLAMSGVEVSFTLYPDSGAQRIVEVNVNYPQSASVLRARAGRLAASANALLATSPPAGEAYTVEELAALIPAPYDSQGSADPEQVLAGASASDVGLLLTLELLFHQSGEEATMVLGQRGQEQLCWLIVATPEGYRHLLSQDLAAWLEQGGALPLYTDRELTEAGFTWQSSLYPRCA